MTNKIKIGVVGTGHLGSIHTKIWSTNPEIELVGIYDVSETRAREIAGQYSIKCFTSLDELIAACDAVTIAVPTTYHYEVAKKSILAGLHCFIEKPITQTYDEALELIRLAHEQDVLIQVGHVERFNSALTALRGQEINPLFIEGHRLSQFKPRATDVSVIHDLMIHDIDIVLWLTKSKVKSIEANGVAVLTDTPDIANARIIFENGAVANLTASRISAHPMRKLRIFRKNAYFSIDFANQNVEVYKIYEDGVAPSSADSDTAPKSPAIMLGTIEAGIKNKNIFFEQPAVPSINAIEEEQHAFIRSISGEGDVLVTGEAGAEALRIAEKINEIVIKHIHETL